MLQAHLVHHVPDHAGKQFLSDGREKFFIAAPKFHSLLELSRFELN
jgi:hypothetical protein